MAKPDVLQNLIRKMSSDPAIQRQIAEAFFQLTTSNPDLGRRLLAGDKQAVFEAYQTLIRNNGNIPMPSGPPRIGASPIGPGETVGGVSGPGVPVNPGTGLIPAPPRGLPNDPSATRQLTTTGGDAPDALDSAAREITVIDATPSRPVDDGFQLGDDMDDVGNVVIEGGPNTDLTVPQYAPASRGPLPPENPFTPAVSTRPRLGHSPAGPGVPVGGPAGGPRGLVPAGPRRPDVPGWVPYAATAGVVGGLGGAIYMGTRPGEARVPGVDADLDAAATDITPDAEMKSANPAGFAPDTSDLRRKLPGETMAQYAARVAREMGADTDEALRAAEERAAARNAGYRDALRRQADAEVRAKGSPANYADTGLHTDYRSPYGPMNNFAEGATVTVDGVRVPGFDLGDGRLRYRLRDVKAAQEAERDARWLANHRAMIDEENAKYGHYSISDTPDKLTPAQEEARDARRRAESAEQNSTRAKELRRQRLHARAGIPEQATDNMSENERLRMMGRNAESARDRASREAVIRRAQAQQNPMEYLGRADINDWQQMVMADRLLRAGAGQMTPLGVEAVGGQNALNMLRGMNLGQGMDNPLVRAQANAANVQTEAAQRAMRAEDEQVLGEKYAPAGWFGYDEFTIEEQQQMFDDLVSRGYTVAEAQAAVDRQATKRRASDPMQWNK